MFGETLVFVLLLVFAADNLDGKTGVHYFVVLVEEQSVDCLWGELLRHLLKAAGH